MDHSYPCEGFLIINKNNNYMSDKVETYIFEWCDKRDSGFFLDGTDRNPVYLNAPERAWIPNTGFCAKEIDEVDVHGKPTGKKRIVNTKIRYIENDNSIFLEDQEARKVEFNKKGNKIFMEKGYMYITETPSSKPLLEYLLCAYYRKSAPHRPDSVTPLYDIVKLNERAEKNNYDEELVIEAKSLLYKLRSKVKDGYQYNEEKVNKYCSLFNVYAGDDIAVKFSTLSQIAGSDPEKFIKLISIFDSSINTEVHQAIDMKIISIADGVASFTDGEKILKIMSKEKLPVKDAIEEISDFLQTSEGTGLLTELRARVEAKTNKKLANK